MNKRALLIAGDGALGSNTYAELLNIGCEVDVICLDEHKSDNPLLNFYSMRASIGSVSEFLKGRHYDSIVNYLHYSKSESYKPWHELLSANCDQLVFLSSYRVYADLEHPVTENAPQLGDVSTDEEFLANEDYALGKYRCEKYLRSSEAAQNYTIIRPVISFYRKRFGLICHSGDAITGAAKNGTVLPLPIGAKNLTAGFDWAGNSGKLIAHLLFKPETLGEAYTIGSGQNLKWHEIAAMYEELFGLKYEWIDDDEYLKLYPQVRDGLLYDRLFDRDMDCSKVLKATGLKQSDFKSIRDAMLLERDLMASEM